MRNINRILVVVVIATIIILCCRTKNPENKFAQFDDNFFIENVPEFPGARLLTKEDIPENQRQFFDEERAQLQLIYDVNDNSTPDYIICGVADSLRQKKGQVAYFITMFEQTDSGFVRLHIQPLRIAPVNLKPAENRSGVLISFAFHSDYAAEIYYENNEFHLQRWY